LQPALGPGIRLPGRTELGRLRYASPGLSGQCPTIANSAINGVTIRSWPVSSATEIGRAGCALLVGRTSAAAQTSHARGSNGDNGKALCKRGKRTIAGSQTMKRLQVECRFTCGHGFDSVRTQVSAEERGS